MSTPYRFALRIPAPPHPTPVSGSKVARPPIHNPYDKFTQPEFDAWIGGLTGALKHALGQVEEEKASKDPEQTPEGGISLAYVPVGAIDSESEEDGTVEDSFAEFTARRAVGKGKARDPREGPGFQGGNRFQPIEIVSSDEEDEEEVVLAIEEEYFSEGDEVDEGDISDHPDNGYSWERGQGPSENSQSHRNASEPPWERADDDEEYEYGSQPGDYHDHGEEDYDDEYEEKSSPRKRNKGDSPGIIEIASDNDEDVAITPAMSARYIEEDGEEEGVREDGSESEYSDEDEGHGSSQLIQRPLIRRPRDADDEGSVKGDDNNMNVAEEVEQPSDEDTSFPSRISQVLSPNAFCRAPVEIRDPWSGPRMYAEDFYSGGDIRPSQAGVVDPNRLGPNDHGEENQADFEDAVQPLVDDTSFPPQHEPTQTLVDIPNPWEGAQIYAEDYYSGGDVQVLPEQNIDSSLLTGSAGDGFDAFLTPGVLTPFAEDQTCQDGNDLEVEGREEGQGIYNDNEEDDRVIQPPQQHIPSSRPPGIEIINVDDSEEEAEIEQSPLPSKNIDGALTNTRLEEVSHIFERNFVNEIAEAEEHDQLMEDVEESIGDMAQPIPPLDSSPPREPDVSFSDWPQDAIPYLEANNAQGEEELQGKDVQEVAATQVVDSPMGRASIAAEVAATSPEQLVQASPAEDIVMDGSGKPTDVNASGDIPPTALEEATYITPPQLVGQESALTVELSAGEEEFEVLLVEVTKPESTGISIEGEEGYNVVLPTEVTEPEFILKAFSIEPEEVVIVEHALSDNASSENSKAQAEHCVVRQENGIPGTHDSIPEALENFESQPKEIIAVEGKGEVAEQEQTARTDVEASDYWQMPGHDTQDQVLEGLAVPFRQEDDDTRSTPGLDEDATQQPPASTSSLSMQPQTQVYQPHIFDYEQLPTPPSEEVHIVSVPSVTQGQAAETSPAAPKRHRVEIEEIPDEMVFQPVSEDLPEFDFEMEVQERDDFEHAVPKAVVVDDAARGFDADVEVISVRSTSVLSDQTADEGYEYEVEEPRTEGGFNEKPVGQVASIGVASIGAYEADEFLESERLGDEDNFISKSVGYSGNQADLPILGDTQVGDHPPETREAHSSKEQPVGHNTAEEYDDFQPPAPHELRDTPALQDIPIPVTANADDVSDHTSRPGTPPAQVISLPITLPGSPNRKDNPVSIPLASGEPVPISVPVSQTMELRQQGPSATTRDGLLTPAEPSGPASDSNEEASAKLLTELARAFFGSTAASEEHWNMLGASFSDFPDLPQISGQSTQVIAEAGPSTLSIADMTAENEEISTPVRPMPNPQAPSMSPPSPPPIFMGVELTKKSTDPVLFSDPYPASLSTPSTTAVYSVPDPFTDDVGSNGLSTSLFDREPEDKDNTSVLDDMDGLEFSYPTDNTDAAHSSHIVERATKTGRVNGLETLEIASDHHVTATPQLSFNQAQASIPTMTPDFAVVQSAEDPFKLMGNASLVAPDEVKVDGGFVPAGELEDSSSKSGYINPALIAQSGPIDAQSAYTALLTAPPDAPTTVTQPTKRKRATSPNPISKKSKGRPRKSSKPVRIQEIRNAEDSPTSTETIHVKPRGKPNVNPTKREGSEKPSEGSRSSSASAAYRLLRPLSRASSIASSAPSDKSSTVQQPSPTLDKPNISLGPLAPVSLLHAHGRRKNNAHPHFPQTVTQPNTHRKSQPIRVPSFSRPSGPSRTKEGSPSTASIASTSTTAVLSPSTSNAHILPAPPPVPAPRHTPTSSSPITRSHCRYHRISLPKEEGGPRVCFLVPGCSLTDRELMEDEEIEDHGDATYEDSLRMVKDIETLDFDSYLLGVIRQLVGLDILREQEVFYLPQPGEEIIRKPTLRRSFSERSSVARPHATDPASPARSSSFYSPSVKAPVSAAGSTSTSHSVLRRMFDSERDSVYAVTDNENSDDENGKEHVPKRVQLSPGEQSELGTMGPPTAQPLVKISRSRRSKLADVTYEPDEAAHEESDEHDGSSRKRRKKASKRGTKRTRSKRIVGDDGNDRQSKKLKAHATTPSLPPPRMERSP